MIPSQTLKFDRPLWEHQAKTLDRFAPMKEAALLHEMGTGKTTTAIAWTRWKFRLAQNVLPTLIISPVATLPNWLEEIQRNSSEQVSKKAAILYGDSKKRLKILDEGSQILVTNPETLDMPKVLGELRAKHFEILIVDEVHRFKNHSSKRFKNLLTLSDFIPHRMIMTGTPILNSQLDIWALWRVLDRGATFGQNFYVFREKYFRDENAGWKGKAHHFPSYVPRPGIDAEISKLIDQKASRVKKEHCLDLPPLVKMIEYVGMGDEQSRVYHEMLRELVAYVKGEACVATTALVKVLRMLQILSGYAQVDTKEWDGRHRIKDNPRFEKLKDLLEELTPRHKVIVWATFQENYKAISELCEELGVKYSTLTGQTRDRDSEIKAFQNDPSVRVMISNPQAGGVGVNLIQASYAIYFSRSFSLGDRLQSEARNYRGGSEIHDKITLIDLVAKDTLDEDVLKALSRKEDFSEKILEKLQKLS